MRFKGSSDIIYKKRLIKYLFINLIVLIIALLTVGFRNFIVKHSELYILSIFSKCPSSLLFHIYCPFCGGTRAVSELIRLNIFEAVKCNFFVVFLSGLFLYYDISALFRIIRGKDKIISISKTTIFIVLTVMLVFFIARNTALAFGYDYLGDL